MLNLAKKTSGDRIYVSFQIADAQKLPFEDDFFHCTSISLVLLENEMVVRRGGALIFMDFRAALPKGPYLCLIYAVEFMVGWGNYGCFKNFMEQGGLGGILRESHLPEGARGGMNNKILEIVNTTNV